MTDDVKKDDKPTAQVFRLVTSGNLPRLSNRNPDFEPFKKDLGPNGGKPPADAIQPNAFEPEDEYQQLYVGATRDQGVVQPPFNLRHLDALSQENNTLGPCIECMVTNIDGTGYEFVSEDTEEDDAADDPKVDALEEFFAQPWPDMSFKEMRRVLRRDRERTGNAYIEVLRNAQDEIVMFRHVDAKMMRILRLDDAVPVEVSVMRGGTKQTLTVMKRERRFCQLVNGVTLMYFKEFGSKRDLHKKTAVWSPMGQRLPAAQRATEIIHFTAIPDAHTPYGVPRWIPQTPSVLGSRKAEEFNLEFFDNGGVPPVMIILQGGTLQAVTRQAIEEMNAGPAKKKNRMMVLEVEPAGGGLNQPTPQARVAVERFGADRTTDSMFEKYDERCEERVRRAFRLPQIFLGNEKSYNFATAFAAYTVAEAQVFKPERDEFDEIFTMKLLPEMGYDGYKLRSKPLVIEDATLQLQGIEVISAMGDQVEPADVVQEVNKITGTKLKVSDDAPTLGDKMAQQQQQALMQHQVNMASAQAGATGQMGAVKPINPQPKFPTGLPTPGSVTPSGGVPGAIKPKPVPGVMGGNGTPVQAPARKGEGNPYHDAEGRFSSSPGGGVGELLHGTRAAEAIQREGFKLNTGAAGGLFGHGAYLTPDLNLAQRYGDVLRVDTSALGSIKEFTEREWEDFEHSDEVSEMRRNLLSNYEGDKESYIPLARHDAALGILKSQGFDGHIVERKASNNEKTYIIYDPAKLKVQGVKKADLPKLYYVLPKIKKSDGLTVPDLALTAMKALRKRDLGELAWALPIISSLDSRQREELDHYVAELAFVDTSFDPVGLAELASATMDVMAGCGHPH